MFRAPSSLSLARGGASRSESIISMIAVGNHTKIQRERRPEGSPNMIYVIQTPLASAFCRCCPLINEGDEGTIHIFTRIVFILLHGAIFGKSFPVGQKKLDSGGIIWYNMGILNKKGVDSP